MEISLWTAIIAMLFGAGLVCLGVALGWFMGKQVRAVPTDRSLTLQPLMASVEQLRAGTDELARLAAEEHASKELIELIVRLSLSLDDLRNSISGLSSPVQVGPQNEATHKEPQQPTGHSIGSRAVSNGRILEWFNERTRLGEQVGELRRYPFAVQQLVAAQRGEDLPDSTAFQYVQCHDLSAAEIRYIAEDRPKQDQIVIGLGLPRPVKFLAARIEDYRSVYLYGRVGYLVTAQFVAALDHEPYLSLTGTEAQPAIV